MDTARLVVVIGGSGFVGTRLCERLQALGRRFLIVDKRPSETFPECCVVADVRDLQALRSALPGDSIWINLAAEHRDDVHPKSLYHEVNVTGAENICEVAREKNVENLIFTSSVACYGNTSSRTGEAGSISPFNEYGRTKFLAEEVFRRWWHERPSSRSLLIIRPTVIFGERNRGNVYNLMNQIASGRFLMIGSGKNIKSMAYVGNVVEFILFMLDRKWDSVVCNYVDEPQLDMNSLILRIKTSLGRSSTIGLRIPVFIGVAIGYLLDAAALVFRIKLPISAVRVRKFTSSSEFSSNASSFGFKPLYPLAEAISQTIESEFGGKAKSRVLFYSE